VKKTNHLYASLLDKFKADYPMKHRTTLKNVLVVLCTILVKETVNLNRLKNQVGVILGKPDTEADSHYKRLTRFFQARFHQRVIWKLILKAVVNYIIQQLDQRQGGKYLLLDATSWEFGKVRIQLLVLSILYQGIAIPIAWVNLAKKGHSNFTERKRLLQMAQCIYPLQGMTLLADREYISRPWFTWLVEVLELDYIIRVPINDYKGEINQGKKRYSRLIKQARAGKMVSQDLMMEGIACQFIAFRNESATTQAEELVLLLTSLKANKQRIARLYAQRWHTECLFKNWKSNGFHLEELSLINPAKIRLMVSLVIAAYVLCAREGIRHLNQIRSRTTKEGRETRYISLFRKGYTFICLVAQQIERFLVYLIDILGKPIRTLKPT
jgi:hypothetical protein